MIRQVEQQYAEQKLEPSPSLRDEPATQNTTAVKIGDLKKQSQFVPGLNGATSYLKGDYDKMPAAGEDENKANQTQLQKDLQHVKGLRGQIATAIRACQ